MKINWFGESYNVPISWWLTVIITLGFILIVCAIGGKLLSKNIYVCPNCGHQFKKKWYKLMLSIHINDERYLKCPECKKASLCSKARI